MLQLLSLLLFTLPSTPSESPIRVPHTSAGVMIDGVLAKAEWQNAARVDVPGIAELYFQRSREFVYIAVKYTQAPSGIVDLYLSPAGREIYNLHASAKLGERQLQSGAFPDWIWWNNRDWVANVSRVDSFEKRTFLPAPIREFQIRLSRFQARSWHVRFELTAMGANNEMGTVTVFPEGTGAQSTAGWLVLDLK